jgi:hypothetical protein
MVSTDIRDAQTASPGHPSPPLLLLSVAHIALFIGGIIATIVIAGAPFPSPFEPGTQAYYAAHPMAPGVAGLCLIASAIPFGLFAAVASSRLRFLGIQAAGVSIALFGGISATIMLVLSGATNWTLSSPEVTEAPAVARALQLLAFAAGGPAFTALFGLLIAGLSISGALAGYLRKWLMWFGVIVAAIAELSLLTFVFEPAAYLLPAARFSGLIWLVCTSVMLPTTRNHEPGTTRP